MIKLFIIIAVGLLIVLFLSVRREKFAAGINPDDLETRLKRYDVVKAYEDKKGFDNLMDEIREMPKSLPPEHEKSLSELCSAFVNDITTLTENAGIIVGNKKMTDKEKSVIYVSLNRRYHTIVDKFISSIKDILVV